MTFLTLRRTLGLILVALDAQIVEGILNARGVGIGSVTLEATLNVILGFGRVMACYAVRQFCMGLVVEGNRGLFIHALVNGDLIRRRCGDSH